MTPRLTSSRAWWCGREIGSGTAIEVGMAEKRAKREIMEILIIGVDA
jgi:hypothetical protein